MLLLLTYDIFGEIFETCYSISLVKLFDFVMMCYSYLDNFVLFQGERFWQKKKTISCVCGEGCAIAWLNKVLGRF